MKRTKQYRQKLREEAEIRNSAYAKLTLEQKLARHKLGGKVATRLLKATAEKASKK